MCMHSWIHWQSICTQKMGHTFVSVPGCCWPLLVFWTWKLMAPLRILCQLLSSFVWYLLTLSNYRLSSHQEVHWLWIFLHTESCIWATLWTRRNGTCFTISLTVSSFLKMSNLVTVRIIETVCRHSRCCLQSVYDLSWHPSCENVWTTPNNWSILTGRLGCCEVPQAKNSWDLTSSVEESWS